MAPRLASDERIRELMEGGYKALAKLREEGAIKAIGAGINEWQVAETLARSGDFDVFLLAGRYTLLEQDALESFLPYCVEKNIGVVIGGPYNSGILATGPKRGAFYNYAPASPEILDRVGKIQAICKIPWRQTCRRRRSASRSAIPRSSPSFPAARSRAKCAATRR